LPEKLTGLTIADFAAATAAKTPTPGGGSVAGVVGALAAALGEMALAFTRGKKVFAEHEADYQSIAGRLEAARRSFLDLVVQDALAYDEFQLASRSEGPEKSAKVQSALRTAIAVPRQMTAGAMAMLADMESLAGRCNKWLLSDLTAGAVLAEAVVRLCDLNVRINAGQLDDRAECRKALAESEADLASARKLAGKIEKECGVRMADSRGG
jgi:formiminotetrahydrofolate cyclodeaminase